MTAFVVVCPFVHRPSFEGMLATLAPSLAAEAIVIDNTAHNLGAAGSRNVGARELLERGADWLVDISPATRFGPPGGTDFVALLEQHAGRWVVQSSTPVNWHCIAWNRELFERVGFFDENMREHHRFPALAAVLDRWYPGVLRLPTPPLRAHAYWLAWNGAAAARADSILTLEGLTAEELLDAVGHGDRSPGEPVPWDWNHDGSAAARF